MLLPNYLRLETLYTNKHGRKESFFNLYSLLKSSSRSAVKPVWLQQLSDNVELQLDPKHNVNVII